MHVRITNAISAVPAITLLSRSHGLAMRPTYIFLFFAKFEPHIFLFYPYHSIRKHVNLFLTLTGCHFFKIIELKREVI